MCCPHKRVLKAAHKNLAVVAENEDGVRSVQMTTEDGLRVSAREFYESFAQSDEERPTSLRPPHQVEVLLVARERNK